MEQFQVDQAFQQNRMIERMNECDLDDQDACLVLAEEAAKTAHEVFHHVRIGAFVGDWVCIIYANMGRDSYSSRDRFRRTLAARKVEELGVAVWPKRMSASAAFTWAILVDHPDADQWLDLATKAWLEEMSDS